MSKLCIECGEPAKNNLIHPDWPADAICNDCHPSKWDEWVEVQIGEYLDAVGSEGAYSNDLKEWRR